MEFSTVWPPNASFGPGVVNTLGKRAQAFGSKRALIVTDRGLSACGIAGRVRDLLAADGIESTVFDEVQPNPTMTEVRRGVTQWKEGRHDLLVALGGGSSMDAAKVIAAQILTGRPISELVSKGVDDVEGTPPAFVCIPTTSGTGSEATSAAMVKDDDGRKYLVRSLRCRPTLVLLDPELTLTVPPRMTAATGMDALIHSIGAYTNRSVHPIADALALEAIGLVHSNLVRAVEQGDDLEARTAMMLASHLSGIAISCKGNDAVHGLSTPVESLLDVTHGESLSAILPHVLRFNLPAAQARFARMAQAMGVSNGSNDADAAARAVSALIELRDRVGVSRELAGLGVAESMIGKLTEMAVASRSTQLNCRSMQAEEVAGLYRKMLEA